MDIHNQAIERRGYSLLEMIFASALMAGTLVPALSVMRDSMAVSRKTTTRALLANYAVLTVERHASLAIATWNTGTTTDDFASEGRADIVSIATTSDDPSDGGIVNSLMSVEVTVFEDVNANTTLDAGEIAITMRTKVAKLNTYENEEQ